MPARLLLFSLLIETYVGYYLLTSVKNLNYQHFQRDIVRGVEGYIVHGSKQVEIGECVANVVLLWQGSEFTVVIH